MKDNRPSSRKLISFSQFLYENSSKTIQNLADEFGSENMYSRMMDFTFDDDSLKRMFKTLDRSLFDSKIVDIYMQISGADDIGKFVRATSKDDLKSYDFYALYFTAFDFIYNKTAETDDLSTIEDQAFSYDKVKIQYFQRRLFVNSDMLHDSNMIFAANCICHEMIHMFDQKFGEGEDAMMKSSRLQIDINTHSTPTFMKMKKKAMRDKMKIIDDGQGMTYEQLNKEAYDFMMSESENPPALKLDDKGEDGTLYVDMSDIMHDVGGFKMTGKHSGVMIYCD